jgi:hypothetical protein
MRAVADRIDVFFSDHMKGMVADFFAVADKTDDWRRSAHDDTISRQRRTGKDYSLVNARCA